MLNRFAMLLLIAFFAVNCLLTAACTSRNDISGTWKGKITLPDTGKSLSDLEFSLTQQGKEVTGTMVFTKPGAKLPLTGTVTDGKVSLSSPMKNGLAVSISGILESRRKISGTAVLDYDAPQLGKRQDRTVLELTR
jgi:hypothetical protein